MTLSNDENVNKSTLGETILVTAAYVRTSENKWEQIRSSGKSGGNCGENWHTTTLKRQEEAPSPQSAKDQEKTQQFKTTISTSTTLSTKKINISSTTTPTTKQEITKSVPAKQGIFNVNTTEPGIDFFQ